MKTSDDKNKRLLPGLLGIAIIFWSWTVELWPLGVILALIIEAPKFSNWRYHTSDKNLGSIIKLIIFLIVFSFVLLLIFKLTSGIYIFVKWLPFFFMPFIFIQVFSGNESFPVHILINAFGKKQQFIISSLPKSIDLTFLYLLLILISSSIIIENKIAMFIYFFLIIIIGIYKGKPKHYSIAKFVSTGSLILILSIAIQSGLTYTQELTTDWLLEDWSQTNTSKSNTAIGDIGSLKVSNKILMRIKSSNQGSIYLRQANYSFYTAGTWYMQDLNFTPLRLDAGKNKWFLDNSASALSNQQLSISTYLKKSEGILALPAGAAAISLLRTGKLFINANRSVKIQNSSHYLDYHVLYDAHSIVSSEPNDIDLNIPVTQKKLIDKFVSTLALKQLNKKDALNKLAKYFEENFRYSLIQDKSIEKFNALSYFLNTSHKGHCELYATIGALILRELGIPTRYVTGYLMTEYDNDSKQYLVRQRHAHAWIQAYVNNQWIELDYTPSIWADLEADNEPWWQGFYDLLDYRFDQLQRWWQDKDNSTLQIFIILASIIFLIFYIRSLNVKSSNVKWRREKNELLLHNNYQKTDETSPFNLIIDYLNQNIEKRNPNETIYGWVQRINHRFIKSKSLRPLINLHYSLIYGSLKLTDSELVIFTNEVEQWIESVRKN